jgi:mRNA interferase MazF
VIQRQPRRGDVYWVDWEPARGSEQRGRRPSLIVQNDAGNESSLTTIVVALTTRIPSRPYPFLVQLEQNEAGRSRPGRVNCSQLLTIDKSRLLTHIGRVSSDGQRRVDLALKASLGLT